MSIDDATEYRQVTVRMKHQGVCLRGYKLGKEIGTKQQSFVKKGQFILSKIDARNGAFGIIPDDLEGAIITNDFLTYDVNEKELNIQLFSLLTSQPTFDDICNKASTGTTNRKRLSEREFLAQEITVPPIEEQDSFINHFKKIQALQENTKIELAIQADLIAKLRSSILSDAVSGRLVPQDPTDEPASMLLEQIKAEKERLIKEGKLKRDKPLAPITADEIPYELPDGWVWCRLGEIIESLQNGLSKRDGESGPFVTVLRLADITNSKINLADTRSIRLNDNEQQKYSIHETDILITRVNGSVDIVGNFNTCISVINPLAYCDHFMRMRLFNGILPLYIALVEKTAIVRDVIKVVFKSTAGQKTVNQGHINSLLLPLPPLNEQHRIVTKIEKLIMTCDALEAEVAKSRAETDRLMQTVLKEAFNGTK